MDRTRWGLVALVFFGGLMAAVQFAKVSLTLPLLAEAFGRDLAAVAVLVSMVGLVGLIFGAMAGGIAAALGPGRTFLGGLVFGGALSLMQAAMPGYGGFAALRVLEGFAHLALVVGGPPLMAAAASDRDRPLAMGLWAVFFGLAFAIAARLFPLVTGAGGLPLLFAAHGVLMLATAAALWRRVPRIPVTRPSIDPVAMHRAIYGRLRTVAPGLGFVPYTFLFIAMLTFLPGLLDAPILATTLPLVTLLTTLLGGALCRRFAPHDVAAVGYAGTILGMLGLAAGVPGAAHLAFAALGVVPGASFAAIPHLNPDPRDRTRATGAIAQLGNLGTVTGTPVVALLLGWGLAGVIGITVAVAALGLALVLWSGHAASGTPARDTVDVP
ncbi:MFS transporter [uncultured Jannaschia sp.]|uniref:MFS transporter n=1 Tax=uncultured Jannaschia sp. TaxID=293347 RepID=UPI00260AD98D|nr:MFS transporter [uncultured Jannaschia sp.]